MAKKEINYKRGFWFLFVIVCLIIIEMIGVCCNFLAVTQNGGKMPVYNAYINSEKHFGYYDNKEVKFYLLSDRIEIGNFILSIGDILMIFSVGFMILIYILMFFTRFGINQKYNKI